MGFFGIISTILIYMIFYKFKNNKFIKKIPIIVSVGVSLICILKIFKIDYETYNISAKYLSFMIAPATIALAYPMYENSNILFKNKRAMYPAIIIASIMGVLLTYFVSMFFRAEHKVILSMLSKSTTMPIAVEISKNLGGYCELTACVVVLTGLFGGIFGHKILKTLKVKSDVAIGLALGSASHVIGTSACVEKKKYKQVASSTIGLILVGILTVIIALAIKKYIVV